MHWVAQVTGSTTGENKKPIPTKMYRSDSHKANRYLSKHDLTFTFFTGDYRADCWYWESVVFLRKFGIGIVVSVFPDGVAQTFFVFMILCAFIGLHESKLPFVTRCVIFVFFRVKPRTPISLWNGCV